MVLVPFTIYVDVTAVGLGTIAVGFSLNEPLPEKFSGTPKQIGVINLIAVGVATPYGPTTINANVTAGTHYVILGIQFEGIAISAYRLKLEGAGLSVDRTFGVLEPITYVYIAFSVDKNGVVSPISSGTISPGGAPIANTGSGSIYGSGLGDALSEIMVTMMYMMLPIMMMNMTMNMIGGMMTSMVQVVR